EGIQALVEYLYYTVIPGGTKSLYTDAKLYVNCPVTRVQKEANGVTVFSAQTPNGQEFDYAVVSSTQWAAQLSMDFQGFSEAELPSAKITTAHTQHNISSCKLFFPLLETYWDKSQCPDCNIPQIIVTDTLVQDLYGLTWTSKPNGKGVLLASYTWEDDSLKLLPYTEKELVAIVLSKLKEITMSTLGEDITQYIDESLPVTIQWIKEPSYIGCAKLYRAHNEADNMLDLAYNQQYAAASNLYFAGENYGVEGGWTEPALRSALDCVIHMINNTADASFLCSTFNLDTDYPSWPVTVFADVSWQDTGINIPVNITTTITYISGTWTANPNDNGGKLYNANGNPAYINAQPGYTLAGKNVGSLIGKIGETIFLVGMETVIPAGLTGNLELCINDDLNAQYGAGLTDNQGNVMVQVTTVSS
ncbi:MAG: FAD-dependent oxidoreductase, partial [Marinirhabdus sp.]